jgi:hypothetical protein
MDGNQISTSGEWKGKIHIEVRVRGEDIIHKELVLEVSTTKDDLPFLKHPNIPSIITTDATTNTSPIRSS